MYVLLAAYLKPFWCQHTSFEQQTQRTYLDHIFRSQPYIFWAKGSRHTEHIRPHTQATAVMVFFWKHSLVLKIMKLTIFQWSEHTANSTLVLGCKSFLYFFSNHLFYKFSGEKKINHVRIFIYSKLLTFLKYEKAKGHISMQELLA